MPGARPINFRPGDNAELLAEFILNTMAFTTPVPRQEDIGHDLFCVLAERDAGLLRAGPFFTMQVKSKGQELVFSREYEIEWIKKQDNPYLVCIVDRPNLSIDIYSTWNMHNAFLLKVARRIVLVPGGPNDRYQFPSTEEDGSNQTVPLGKPILHITAQDVMNQDNVQKYGSILGQWVRLDRENIVNRDAGMYWVIGPVEYETNQPIELKEGRIGFYWNPNNLTLCLRNFGRSATALRLVIRRAFDESGESSVELSAAIQSLDQTLKLHSGCLEPLARQILNSQIGLDLPESPNPYLPVSTQD